MSTPAFIDPRLFVETDPPPVGMPIGMRASRCDGCARVEFPVRSHCPACDGSMVSVQLSDCPVLDGFTAVLHQPPGALVDAPYAIGLARFPEGISILGLVVDAGVEDLALGDALDVVAATVGERVTYAFRPVPRGRTQRIAPLGSGLALGELPSRTGARA